MNAALEMKAAALRRREARRRPPRTRTLASGPFSDEPMVIGLEDGGGVVDAASTPAEWADDAAARLAPGDPAHRTVIAILAAAAEGGTDAAVAAVRPATRGLDDWQQFAVWQVLQNLPLTSSRVAAHQLTTAIRGEWRRLRLADRRPAGHPVLRKFTVNQADLDASARRERLWGAQPDQYEPRYAGMRI